MPKNFRIKNTSPKAHVIHKQSLNTTCKPQTIRIISQKERAGTQYHNNKRSNPYQTCTLTSGGVTIKVKSTK